MSRGMPENFPQTRSKLLISLMHKLNLRNKSQERYFSLQIRRMIKIILKKEARVGNSKSQKLIQGDLLKK
jgi:hypothetical protein